MDSPFKGLVPYAVEDADYFFGRNRERRVLAANLRASRLTLVYGESGVGKSSLLNAGIANDFRNDPEHSVIVFRSWRDDPLAALTASICTVLPGLDGGFGNTRSDGLVERLRSWSGSPQGKNGRSILVMFDQFEDYLQYYVNQDSQQSFLREFPHLVTSDDLPINFLISIREDALASLDRFKNSIPGLFDNYFRVDYLDVDAAQEAILKPLERFNSLHPKRKMSMDPRLAARVVDEMIQAQGSLDQRVQTPYLQLVMSRWWDHEVKSRSNEMRRRTFVRELGGVKSIVESHLKATIDELALEEQRSAMSVLERLVTSSGRRELRTFGEIVTETQLKEPLLESLLRSLTEARVLTPVAPPKGTLYRKEEKSYEFAHDVLAIVAADWLRQRRHAQELAEAQRSAEEAQRRAEEMRRLTAIAKNAECVAIARERVASSVVCLEADPELSLLLSLHAIEATWSHDRSVLPEAKASLLRALVASRVRLTLSKQSAAIFSLAWSPDGKYFASGGDDKTIWVWEAAEGNSLFTLKGHTAEVRCVAWSPDGQRLASGSYDKTVIIWDVANRKREKPPWMHAGGIRSLAWSPDGSRLASSAEGKAIAVWETATGRLLATIQDNEAEINAVAWSPDSPRLASAGADARLKVRMITPFGTTGTKELFTIKGSGAFLAVAWSPNGRQLASANNHGEISVWDARGGSKQLDMHDPTGSLSSLCWSPDGARLASGGEDRTVRVWDAAGGRLQLILKGHTAEVLSIIWSPDGKRLASASRDGTIKVWDVGNEASPKRLDSEAPAKKPGSEASPKKLDSEAPAKKPGSEAPANVHSSRDPSVSVVWHPDGDRLASAGPQGRIFLWEKRGGFKARQLHSPGGHVTSLSWSALGRWLASGREYGTIDLWDTAEGVQRRFTVRCSFHRVTSLAWCPDGNRLASASLDGAAKVWDVQTDTAEVRFERHGSELFTIAWSPKGTLLASAGRTGVIEVWKPEDGAKIDQIEVHKIAVLCVAWSPDGKCLASASRDGTVVISNVKPKANLLTLRGHNSDVIAVAWSSDGRYLASAGRDGTTRVWDILSGNCERILERYDGSVVSVAWSPKGELLASARDDNSVRLWSTRTGTHTGSLVIHVRGVEWMGSETKRDDLRERVVEQSDSETEREEKDLKELLSLARSRITRNLTREECKRYLHLDEVPSVPFGKDS